MLTRAWLSCVFFVSAQATPQVAFPFNSQVPTVARVDEAYKFQLSPSTFASNAENLTYTIADQPAWLSLNSATRTLTGTPRAGDAGSSEFLLTAADGTGASSMQCTLVISSDPAPGLVGNIAKQLAATANLSSSSPPVVTLLPSTTFKFDFQQDSFIDIIARKLYYYATLVDHTPLPSWLSFDAGALTFSGTAPELSAFPQSWSVNLIASDVKGFAGTTASFTIAIGTQQLVFVPEEQDWEVTVGKHVSFTALEHQLFLNGENISPADLKRASADVPDWLTFDSETLIMAGVVPTELTEQNITISVMDKQGNTAVVVVNLVRGNTSLFNGQIGTIVARAGEPFSYHFDESLFREQDLTLSVAIPADAQWLQFHSATRELSGTVPSAAKSGTIQVTLTVKPSNGGEGQSQVFTIDVKGAASSTTSTGLSRATAHASATSSSTSTPGGETFTARKSSNLSKGDIAAIVVLSTVAGLFLMACLIWYCRRRERARYVETSPAPSKRAISRPIAVRGGADSITVTTKVQMDVEKNAAHDPEDSGPAVVTERGLPPQIHLDLPLNPASRKLFWSKRFSRISQGSSLGVGEDAIRADSNIPELGQAAVGLKMPHDSFAVPADIACVSRQLSQTSKRKRARRRLRERHRSRDSIGLGILSIVSGGIARHSLKRNGKHRRRKSSFGGLSTTREASSMASLSTRGTSVLSTKPSEFPVPPMSTDSASPSVPTASFVEADLKRRSIRLVERSDSVATDSRPIADKRESFIRNRASVRVQSPLFAHGSRASSNNTRQTGSSSIHGSLVEMTRRSKNGKSLLATYSESCSLEPQPDNLRRSQTREPKPLSQRAPEAFPANFPRAVSQFNVSEGETRQANRESSSEYTTTSESMTSEDWIRAEMAKPRHERSFVLPGEASPTPPPPAPPTSRQQTVSRQSTPGVESGLLRQQWRQKLREKSSSPLSSQVRLGDSSSPSISRKMSSTQRNKLGEPMSLVSADSIHKARRRIVHTKSHHPVDVEGVQRLDSMKAEQDTATSAGGEQWDDIDTDEELEEVSLMATTGAAGQGSTVKSARSDLSGLAFL